MAAKSGGAKGKRRKKKPNQISGVPLGSALDVVEGAAGLLGGYLSQRYEVEKRVEQRREETTE